MDQTGLNCERNGTKAGREGGSQVTPTFKFYQHSPVTDTVGQGSIGDGVPLDRKEFHHHHRVVINFD